MIIACLYAAPLLTGLLLSFGVQRRPLRKYIRWGTFIFSIPVIAAIACLLVLMIGFRILEGPSPPTLPELQRQFYKRQADLEAVLRMADADSDYTRIALTFVDRASEYPGDSGRYMEGDPRSRLSADRWNTYRKVFERLDVRLGIQRNTAHDAFIMVQSEGLLNRGHTSGYLHCAATTAVTVDRYAPCISKAEKGQQAFKANPRTEAYSFQHIKGDWYAYDEGPY